MRSLREQGNVPRSTLSAPLVSSSLLLLLLVPGTSYREVIQREDSNEIIGWFLIVILGSSVIWMLLNILVTAIQTQGYLSLRGFTGVRKSLDTWIGWRGLVAASLIATSAVCYSVSDFLYFVAAPLNSPKEEVLGGVGKAVTQLRVVVALILLVFGLVCATLTRLYFRWIHRERSAAQRESRH